jgi:hypothetical protein
VEKLLELLNAAPYLLLEIGPRCGDYMIKIKPVKSVRATPHNYLFHHTQLAPICYRITNIEILWKSETVTVY